MKESFETIYPYLHLYLCYQGYIEIGGDEHSDSWVRVLDEGGMRIECDKDSLGASLLEAEAWAAKWMSDCYESAVIEAGLEVKS
ncbi:MAG: hypothetical protein AAGI49_16595 [Bacteroidota bacterium]